MKKLLIVYQYLYYILYKLASINKNSWETNGGIPHWGAKVLISVLGGLNLMSVFVLSNQLLNYEITLTKLHGIIISILLYTFNYFVFIKNKQYLAIVERFDGISRNKRLLLNLLGSVFMIILIVMFFMILKKFAKFNA